MTTSHERYAEAVAGGAGGGFEDGIKDSVLVAGEGSTGAVAFFKNLLQVLREAGGHGHGVSLPRVAVLPL